MWCRLLLGFVVFVQAASSQAEPPRLLTEKEFNSRDLAVAANYYIDLGEEAAVKELLAHFVDWENDTDLGFSRNERVGWICRIVYEPKGDSPLRQPWFGTPSVPWNTMPLESWPKFPLVYSGRSYFVLKEGNNLLGSPENPKRYLDYCRAEGKFRKRVVALPGATDVMRDAEKVFKSDAWKVIKWTDKGSHFHYEHNPKIVMNFIRSQTLGIPK